MNNREIQNHLDCITDAKEALAFYQALSAAVQNLMATDADTLRQHGPALEQLRSFFFLLHAEYLIQIGQEGK